MISVACCADAVDGRRGGLDWRHGSQHARAQAGLRRHAAHDVSNTTSALGSRFGIERLSNHRADRCNASSPAQTRAMAYGMSGQPATRSADLIQDLANFLLIRGPYSWLGWGWKGCSQHYYFPPEFNEVRKSLRRSEAPVSLLSWLFCARRITASRRGCARRPRPAARSSRATSPRPRCRWTARLGREPSR